MVTNLIGVCRIYTTRASQKVGIKLVLVGILIRFCSRRLADRRIRPVIVFSRRQDVSQSEATYSHARCRNLSLQSFIRDLSHYFSSSARKSRKADPILAIEIYFSVSWLAYRVCNKGPCRLPLILTNTQVVSSSKTLTNSVIYNEKERNRSINRLKYDRSTPWYATWNTNTRLMIGCRTHTHTHTYI